MTPSISVTFSFMVHISMCIIWTHTHTVIRGHGIGLLVRVVHGSGRGVGGEGSLG